MRSTKWICTFCKSVLEKEGTDTPKFWNSFTLYVSKGDEYRSTDYKQVELCPTCSEALANEERGHDFWKTLKDRFGL